MGLEFLCWSRDSICLPYKSVAKLLTKNHNIFELVRAQSNSEYDQAVIGVTHLDNGTLYVIDGDNAMLLFQDADFHMKNNSRSSPFSFNPFTSFDVDSYFFSINCATASTTPMSSAIAMNHCNSERLWTQRWEIRKNLPSHCFSRF